MLQNYGGKYSVTGGNALHQVDLKIQEVLPESRQGCIRPLTGVLRANTAGLMIALKYLCPSWLAELYMGHEIIPDRRDFYPPAASPVKGQPGRFTGRQAIQVNLAAVKGMPGIPVKPSHSCICVTDSSVT